MSEQSKPCPSCGINSWGYEMEYGEITHYYCEGNCGCRVHPDFFNDRPIEDALQARIAELEAENAALKAPKEWISVEDGLPNTDFFSDFVYVLLYHKGYKSVCVDRLRRIGDFDRYEWTIHPFKDSNKYPVVVAWSPLPEPPEEE